MVARKLFAPQEIACREMKMAKHMHTKEKRAGERNIWYMLTPPAFKAISSLSVLMRKKVRKTLSIQDMGTTKIRNDGAMYKNSSAMSTNENSRPRKISRNCKPLPIRMSDKRTKTQTLNVSVSSRKMQRCNKGKVGAFRAVPCVQNLLICCAFR